MDKNDWFNKAWQEVIKDAKTTRMALNPIVSSKGSISSEISKYLSKAKTKDGSVRRWYSFSDGFRGCRPKLARIGSTYVPSRYLWWGEVGVDSKEHDWELCREQENNDCSCRRPVIVWDFGRRNNYEYRNVFINDSLIKMMIGGK